MLVQAQGDVVGHDSEEVDDVEGGLEELPLGWTGPEPVVEMRCGMKGWETEMVVD